MKTLVRLEESGFALFSIYLFSLLRFPWWYFPLLFFVPDVSMLAYLGCPRLGAFIYNLVHHRALALAYYVAGLLFGVPLLALAGVIIFAHSSFDRAMGYALKFADGFNHTHLGIIGRESAT